MNDILKEIFITKTLIPQKYTVLNEQFLVDKNFIVPFSHSVDYLFESLDTIIFEILTYLQNGKSTNIDDIKNFNKEDYLKYVKDFIKTSLEEFAWKEKEVEKSYIQLLDEIEKLVNQFRTYMEA